MVCHHWPGGRSVTKLRVGVIGLGMMGRHHSRVLRGLEGVDVAGAFDPHRSAEGVRLARSLEELIGWGIDAAVVAVPTEDHLAVALQLAEAGVHALIEKPLATGTPEALQILDAFLRADRIVAVGHIERFNPAIRSLKQRLLTGEIGTPFQIATSRQGPFPARIRDVGVVKDLGTHDLDLTTWVAAQKFDTVAARCVYRAGRVHEDLVAVVGSLADGTATNHLVNWLSPMKERRVVVTGERGCLIADTLTADLTFYSNANMASEWEGLSQFRGVSEGDVIRYAIAKPEPLEVELTAFRDAVLGRDGEIVTGQDGLHALQVAEAILRSAQQNTVETIL